MTDQKSTDLRCERVRLLLSLSIDGAATPAQEAEIQAHAPACAACRAAQAVDIAVHERAGEPASIPAGFAERLAARAARQRLEARAQNRFLLATAVAAALVAGVALTVFRAAPDVPETTLQAGAVRDAAGRVLRAQLARARSPIARTPRTGVVEDR